MKMKRALFTLCLLIPPLAQAQGNGLDPAEILKPLSNSWPTYNGDYSGKRYSALTQVNRSNVQHLTLAWMAEVTPGTSVDNERRRSHRQETRPVIVGGEG